MSLTLKTRLFINEPMVGKPVIDVPGVGDVTTKILEAKRITQATSLYKIWLRLHMEKARFDGWLKEMCGASYMQVSADLITDAFKEWHRTYGAENDKENENGDASGNFNRNNINKRQCTDNPAQPRDNKKTRPDTFEVPNSSAESGRRVSGRPASAMNGTSVAGLGSSGSGVTGSGPSRTVTGATESGSSESGATGNSPTAAPTDADHNEPDPSTQSVELDVTLTAEDDQQLNETQTTAVNRYLEESILASAKESNARAPRFKRVSVEDGTLQLSCEDALSLNWLKATIANAPVTGGTKVTVKTKSELVKKFKVALYIPDSRNSVDDTLLLLTKQNEWAEINTWSKHSEMEKDFVLFLEFWVPEPIVHTLLEKGGQLHYKLGSVSAWVTAADTCQLAQRNTRGAQ